jgi:tetratricopeptide (TPR) repeat protein
LTSSGGISAVSSDRTDRLVDLGVFILPRGELAEALRHFRRAIAIKSGYAEAHNNLGAALLSQGGLVEAVAHFRQALAIKPGDAEAPNDLGVALARQGQLGEAVQQYREALKIKPGDADAHDQRQFRSREPAGLGASSHRFAPGRGSRLLTPGSIRRATTVNVPFWIHRRSFATVDLGVSSRHATGWRAILPES